MVDKKDIISGSVLVWVAVRALRAWEGNYRPPENHSRFFPSHTDHEELEERTWIRKYLHILYSCEECVLFYFNLSVLVRTYRV